MDIITLPLRRPQDLLLARQRGRQIAGLLGFDFPERAEVATQVFELARQVFTLSQKCVLHIQLADDVLEIVARSGSDVERAFPALQVRRNLPAQELRIAREDLVFLAGQLARHTPPDLMAEIGLHSQEILQPTSDGPGPSPEAA